MIRFINSRRFLRDFKKEIKNLPFIVTLFGKPIIVVRKYEPGAENDDGCKDDSH